MRIHVLSRSEKELRQTTVAASTRNYHPDLHPFERAREYQRALNAAKLERALAQPLVTTAEGHCDGVYRLATHPRRLADVASGAGDGELRVWRLSRGCLWRNTQAHGGMIVGLSSSADGRLLFSCSGDSGVCAWEWPESFGDAPQQPSSVFRARGSAFSALDVALENSASTATFATGTEAGQLWLWHTDRSEPMLRLQDAAAATEELALITSVRFHPSDASLLSSSGADRRVRLFDVRQRGSVGNTRLPMRANEVAWNPMDTYLLSVATDDHNVYTHDMRRLDRVRSTQVGHVGAVLSVHYSPTGRELCTGSYDSLVRIYPTHARQARDVYYTRRMQRVFAVRFSSDAHYLLSGSDDGNVRVWKTHASEPLRPLLPRERRALDHANALKRKFSQVGEVRRLLRQRHLPRRVHHALRQKHQELASRQRKAERRERHS
ncbi:hypothetical protein CDCA_CDCA15G3950 [Cyanidium caldarium]|uniref:Sof1-like protein domain-containing protein n=1 Tax=Cyanidium caldarium TaxID=2771 RepID=A0AAV9J0L9_CYACA|nr:hypothetical protein CDCA_CDCA15G3950 [Cyanidium caldarium]